MTIRYSDALAILQNIAKTAFEEQKFRTEIVPLELALGRVAAINQTSPICTPSRDTSAMDGYAISSSATVDATTEKPVTFIVQGTIAAGQEPIKLANEPIDNCYPCVEIMTGAQFPVSTSHTPFDACVKIEDTVPCGVKAEFRSQQRFNLTRAVRLHANRRFAGGDMQRGDVIIQEGEIVQSRHIMGLASVGTTRVMVRRRLRVAVWTTGNELTRNAIDVCKDSQIFDSNGPFLAAALREMGAHVDLRGILPDSMQSLEKALDDTKSTEWDLIITTGAVSKGKFDLILPALTRMHSRIHFHGVAIRPGHPVLFATLHKSYGHTQFFGLPGNPVATAACFRFLVVPFLRQLTGRIPERFEKVELSMEGGGRDIYLACPSHLDCFRHGTVTIKENGTKMIALSPNQSPAVVSQFATSNCWAHIARSRREEGGTVMVHCVSQIPPSD